MAAMPIRHDVPSPPSEAPPRPDDEIDYHSSQEKEPNSTNGSITQDAKTLLRLSPDDPDHPWNWTRRKKVLVLLTGCSTVINSTLGSSIPSGAIIYIARDFAITSETALVLPISVFLIGYVVGPAVFGPLSETYGRRIIMISTFALFSVFTMACALAPNWEAFLVFRFVCGVTASSPIAVVGGVFADVFGEPVERGRAMALFMTVTVFGPVIGPIISGFVSPVNWRWTFWVGLIIIGICWVPLIFLPETYLPTIQEKKARALRQKTGAEVYAPSELENRDVRHIVTVVLTRSVRMFLFEPIVLFTCLYLALAYGIFYLFFEAYPIVFQGIYGMSVGTSGLAFIPIGLGSLLAILIFISYDSLLSRSKALHKPWSLNEEYRRLPLACLGGPSIVLSLFWLGWTSSPKIHWIVPMLSGLFFGAGFLLIFMALLNYLTDAYKTYSASALAASSCTRSILGAVLPFAAKPMYRALGVPWATSLLGFVSLAMAVVPFVFLRFGERMRGGSRFCVALKEAELKAVKGEGKRNSEDENGIETGEDDAGSKV